MRRREFITLLGGAAAAWPLGAGAQPTTGLRRIGVITGFPEDDLEIRARLDGFRQGLERLGWSEGRNLRVDYRYAPADAQQARTIVKVLVALHPEVIFAHTVPVVEALQRETSTIPIVFVGIIDPVEQGLVPSLARPGGNLTGFMQFETSIAGKWLAMLKEIAPHLTRAALVSSRNASGPEQLMRAAVAAAPSLGFEPVPIYAESAPELEQAIDAFGRMPNGGLVLLPSVPNTTHRDLLIEVAARNRLPAVHTGRYFVTGGGLMSYGIDRVDEFRQAASYVDRILRGEKPADLPVQAPVKYETVLNLKTAKSLGLTVPDLMIVRADEVIE